jgi:hypothetical protein
LSFSVALIFLIPERESVAGGVDVATMVSREPVGDAAMERIYGKPPTTSCEQAK